MGVAFTDGPICLSSPNAKLFGVGFGFTVYESSQDSSEHSAYSCS